MEEIISLCQKLKDTHSLKFSEYLFILDTVTPDISEQIFTMAKKMTQEEFGQKYIDED